MTTPVLTASKFQLPMNQPFAWGNAKAALASLDFSTYATGGSAITAGTAGLDKIVAVIPLGGSTDQNQQIRILDTDPTKVKLFASEGTETTDNTDGGEFLALLLGT